MDESRLTVEHSSEKGEDDVLKADTFAIEFFDVHDTIGRERVPRRREETPVIVSTRIPENNLNVFRERVVHVLRHVQIDEVTEVMVHVVATVEFDENRRFADRDVALEGSGLIDFGEMF